MLLSCHLHQNVSRASHERICGNHCCQIVARWMTEARVVGDKRGEKRQKRIAMNKWILRKQMSQWETLVNSRAFHRNILTSKSYSLASYSNHNVLISPSTTIAFPSKPAIPMNVKSTKTVLETVHSSSWSNKYVSLPCRKVCDKFLQISPNIAATNFAHFSDCFNSYNSLPWLLFSHCRRRCCCWC